MHMCVLKPQASAAFEISQNRRMMHATPYSCSWLPVQLNFKVFLSSRHLVNSVSIATFSSMVTRHAEGSAITRSCKCAGEMPASASTQGTSSSQPDSQHRPPPTSKSAPASGPNKGQSVPAGAAPGMAGGLLQRVQRMLGGNRSQLILFSMHSTLLLLTLLHLQPVQRPLSYAAWSWFLQLAVLKYAYKVTCCKCSHTPPPPPSHPTPPAPAVPPLPEGPCTTHTSYTEVNWCQTTPPPPPPPPPPRAGTMKYPHKVTFSRGSLELPYVTFTLLKEAFCSIRAPPPLPCGVWWPSGTPPCMSFLRSCISYAAWSSLLQPAVPISHTPRRLWPCTIE